MSIKTFYFLDMKNYKLLSIISLIILLMVYWRLDFSRIFQSNYKLSNIKAYAAISVNLDTNLDFYLFYLPITCLSWRLVDYEPIIIAVVTNQTQTNKLAQKTIQYLEYFNFKTVYLRSVPNHEKMTGMISRLFIGLINNSIIDDEDMIFQTDADLIPMNKTYYQRFHNGDSINILDVSSFQSRIGWFDYYNNRYRMYFMGHIGMKKRQWVKVMKFDKSNYKFNGDSILNLVREYYGDSRIKKNSEISRGDSVWFLDQSIISINIANFTKQDPSRNKLYENNSPGIKLDRIWTDDKWLDTLNNKYKLINDVHLYHENFIEKLPLMDQLFTKMFPRDQKVIIDRYVKEFLVLRKSLNI